MKFFVFAASHRSQSLNRRLSQVAALYLSSKGHEIDFAEYSELDTPLYNDEAASAAIPEKVRQIGKRFGSADGIIISAPEYNWSYPGSLKNMLDWISRLTPLPTAGKTVFLMSASPSVRGGIIGLTHLETPVEALKMYVFPKMFPLGSATNAFASDAALTDIRQQQALFALLDEYSTFTQKLM